MKKFSLIAIYSFIFVGLILVIFPIAWFPKYMDVRYTGWSLLVCSAIVYYLPKLFIVKKTATDAEKKNKAGEIVQFMAALAIAADALGALGLYELGQYGIPYNYFLHFTIPLLSTILLTMFIHQRYNKSILESACIGFVLIVICGLIWELIENFSDFYLGTRLSGPNQSDATNVSVLDIYIDTTGALIGAVIIYLKKKK